MTSRFLRPVLLDLYCGAGGASVGYHRAGFDVVGVDIKHQKNYPFPLFYQSDAITFLDLLDPDLDFDAIHASPPCQIHTRATQCRPGLVETHVDLIAATRRRLQQTGRPWIIENVPGAPMRPDYKLCGCMFGLPRLRRERWFETSWQGFDLRQSCSHSGRSVTVAGKPGHQDSKIGVMADWVESMGIDWMSSRELPQAIPPAYTEYIGHQLIEQLLTTERER